MPDPLQSVSHAAELLRAGRFAEARDAAVAALSITSDHPYLLAILAAACHRLGASAEAVANARAAIAARPADASLLSQLALLFIELDQLNDAATAINAAGGQPSLVELLLRTERFESAAARLQAGSAADNLLRQRAIALQECGRIDEAISIYQSLATRPNPHPQDITRHAAALNFSPSARPEQVHRAHAAYGRLFAKPASIGIVPSRRPVRLGIVSSDLRRHSVAYFIRPLLERLDRARFNVSCFSLAPPPGDDVTAALRPIPDRWIDLHPYDYAGLRAAVRAEPVDILLELNGHTAGCVLPALAERLAPIQATYLGYPNTTGLPSIDFRVVDSLTDPPGAEQFSTERLIRLDPCFLCYTPATAAPLPPSPARPFTFGSFNALAKINEPLLDLWARLLTALPSARLFLKSAGLADPLTRERFARRLSRRGVEPARFSLHGRVPSDADHLAAYHNVDIALDTYPYHGTTTTCEALFMGVPVVTLAGNTHAARVGVSLLSAVGLPELIARTPDDYIAIALKLAADTPRRAELRASLRSRLLASPLCDAHAFALRFADGLDAMLIAAASTKRNAPA